MTITLTLSMLPIAISALLFIAVTVFCFWQKIYDDPFVGVLFAIALYFVFWALPTMLLSLMAMFMGSRA